MGIYVTVAVIAYLLGSIPFGYILVRVFRGEDVRQHGSGNIGATNVARKAPGLGIATLVLDAAKGYAAVALAWEITSRMGGTQGDVLRAHAQFPFLIRDDKFGTTDYYLLIGAIAVTFAIIGHMFPIWLRFKGGKGVATGVGTFLAFAPTAVVPTLGIFALLVLLFRYISLSSIIASATFPVFAWYLYRNRLDRASPIFIAASAIAAALIILKHHQNIRRLLSGTEHRFELKHR